MKKSLRGPALSKAVRDYVKQYIVEHKLEAGDPLPPETHLAEDLGVGRSSVREAIKALQSLGIVEVRHGNGLFVREYNMDPILETLSFGLRSGPVRLAELLQIRLWVEAAAIREAVTKISELEIAELDNLMQEWQERAHSSEKPFPNDFCADLDEMFHRSLYSTLKNHTLNKLFEVFWIVFDELDLPTTGDFDALMTYQDHKQILDAVRQRDPILAEELLISHFGYLKERINSALRQKQESV